MKIAFDENVPLGMVKVFQTFASERQLQKLSGGKFDVKSAKDYTPKHGDPAYVRGSDVPWLKRFAADGGRVVISGNTQMKSEPHERLAAAYDGDLALAKQDIDLSRARPGRENVVRRLEVYYALRAQGDYDTADKFVSMLGPSAHNNLLKARILEARANDVKTPLVQRTVFQEAARELRAQDRGISDFDFD